MHNQCMCTYVGFDPGGIGNFGWAVVSGKSYPLRLVGRGIADHAKGAFDAAMECVGSARISAVGIDAPLFWSPTGDRGADQLVRKAITQLGSPGGTVGHVNALRGACLIQGILVAMMCQQRASNRIPITESHPKALLWLLGRATREHHPAHVALSDLTEYVVEDNATETSEHERDATLGAYAAYVMESGIGDWRDLYTLEPNPITPLSPPPGYWMPC